MTKKIQKHLLNQYIQDDIAPWLFKHQEQQKKTTVRIDLGVFGMTVVYTQQTGRFDVDLCKGAEEWHPRQTLSKSTAFINAEAVRKLFEAKNYSEMICRIKERFQGPTAYDDLLNYLSENRIIEI